MFTSGSVFMLLGRQNKSDGVVYFAVLTLQGDAVVSSAPTPMNSCWNQM